MCQKKIMRKRCIEHNIEEPPKKRISKSGNILPTKFAPDDVLTDLTGKQWKIGKQIGSGGFGDIYLGSDNVKASFKNDAPFVIKVENHTNGPLFVEINCLLRIARPHMTETWKTRYNMRSLGIPTYIASGSHTLGLEKIRFLVLPRFNQDLEKIFIAKQKKFNLKTVVLICSQILDILEYIHSKGYVHCDIKASNILHSLKKHSCSVNQNKVQPGHGRILRPKQNVNYDEEVIYTAADNEPQTYDIKKKLRPKQNINYDENIFEDFDVPVVVEEQYINEIVLIDYGLATKYCHSDGKHKQYCNDERKAHAGTMLFCSLDAHLGAISRRSDLESLGYNMVYWLTSTLPWCDDVSNPETVQTKKQNCLNNVDMFLKSCFHDNCPTFVYDYFNYIKSLSFESKPDYSFCTKLLLNAVLEYGYKQDGYFDFDNLEGWGRKVQKKPEVKKVVKLVRKPLTVSNVILEKPALRKIMKSKKQHKKKLNWSKILADPEEILRQNNKLRNTLMMRKSRERKLTESSDSSSGGNGLQHLDIWTLNPTSAMLEVYYKSLDKNANVNGLPKGNAKGDGFYMEQREGYTHAMNKVLTTMYQKRLEELKNETQTVTLRKTRSVRNNSVKKFVDVKRTKSAINIGKEVKRRTKSTRTFRGHGLRG